MHCNSITYLSSLDFRIPDWNLKSLLLRNCPFCESLGDQKFVRPDSLRIKYCSSCGTFFVSPAPDSQQLEKFYSKYSEHSQELFPPNGNRLAEAIKRKRPYEDIRIAEIASFLKLSGVSVLDVGCGFGGDMYLLKKLGTQVTGIDLDAEALNFVKDKLNIETVHQCSIGELADGVTYDLVLLHDVIEHPLKPLAILEKAVSLLSHNGLISIWTPNASFALKEEEPILFRVDLEHMQYMSCKTFSSLASHLGLEIVHLESVGFPNLRKRIDESSGKTCKRGYLKQRLKESIKSLPGFRFANIIRKAIMPPPHTNLRRGAYNAFCIFQKPE